MASGRALITDRCVDFDFILKQSSHEAGRVDFQGWDMSVMATFHQLPGPPAP